MPFLSSGSTLARAAAGFGLALAMAAGATVAVAPAASAQTVGSGSLSFSGDAGDYISGGQSYSYSTEAQDRLNVSSDSDHQHIAISVDGANGDWWSLDLAAPSGQALTAGEYTGATRYPFNGHAEPGLDLSGNGRGCNMLTGSFTIAEVEFGPNGYVRSLDATYEQHCEGDSAALRGEVHIDNPAPPAELDLGLDIALKGTASTLNGEATVQGTVTCTKPVQADIAGQVTQVAKHVLVRGSFGTQVSCTPGTPAVWKAQAQPTGTTPFQQGDVEVSAQAYAYDTDYGVTATAADTVAVTLKKTNG
ncbi:hypothetical protein [Streptomyces fragilis]|uniref:Secreted protein n=1 Tax=Streptomyces fragilis TaxID=67301 RepID=A0ABV2YRP0_9ACTN|nr:hypothetical protein [Streptomyces fragilis]